MRPGRKLAFVVLLLAAATAAATDVATLRNGFEIAHERREPLGGVTRLYFHADHDSSYVDVATEDIVGIHNVDPPQVSGTPQGSRPGTSPPLSELVNSASERHLVDADLIASVIRAESNFNPHALSPKGAQGLMQLMPNTAARLGVANPFQPEANIDAGVRYLRELLLRYDGNVIKALAAYNAGPERVAQYHGVPPYRETHVYVSRVIRDFNCRKVPADKAALGRHPACSSSSQQPHHHEQDAPPR